MKRIMLFIVVLLFFFMSSVVSAEDSYLCIADTAAGITYNNNEWKNVLFNVDDRKYILRKTEETGQPNKWKLFEFGHEISIAEEVWIGFHDETNTIVASLDSGVHSTPRILFESNRGKFELYVRGCYTCGDDIGNPEDVDGEIISRLSRFESFIAVGMCSKI